MDLQPASTHAPAVVAVVVTHNPGTWFEETLASLGCQDYPNLSVLVIDAASDDDPVPRVARALPSAYVRRYADDRGFGPAANDALEVVSGAPYLLFCHDDVRLEPGAVRLLVEESMRSNAGVAGPKLVAWGSPRQLVQVGMSVDKTGVPWSPVERGELDQEQHDRVRDVFWVPGSCMLVRSDLFEALGGFDAAMSFIGEDLDLCWRAQVVGARVMVVPPARVEHLEAVAHRRSVDDLTYLHARHRLRTMLTCYGVVHLLRVLPQAAVVAVAEVLYAVAVGRFGRARETIAAWTWNLRSGGDLLARHRRLRSLRHVPDADVRRLQVRGSARVRAFVRGEIGSEDRMRALATAGRDLAGSLRGGARRRAIVVWGVLALVLVVGSRGLLAGGIPAVGSLAPFPDSPGDLLGAYLSGWRDTGLGAEAPAPTAFAILGAAGMAFLGAMGQLQKVLVLGVIPLGLLGAWRLAGPVGSSRARLAALVAYAAIPLPYNALAGGRWGGLVLYGAAPWVLARVLRAARLAPFEPAPAGRDPADGGPARTGDRRRRARQEALALGVVVALAAAFVPVTVLVVPVVALAVAAGTALAGGRALGLRAVGVAVLASAVATVVHFPWVLDFVLPGGEWAALGGVSPVVPHGIDLGALLRFQTGPLGAGPLGWAFLAAAALPLLVGQGWRFGAAVQAWSVAVVAWVVAWAGGRASAPLAVPSPEVLLAFAAAGLALAVALGVAAFERDVRAAHFGWRQAVSAVAAAGLAVGTLPTLGAAVDGRWHAPEADLAGSLAFLSEDVPERGAFRVLWVGHPDVLPLSSWRLGDGIGYATSVNGTPDLRSLWASSPEGPTQLLAESVRLAAAGDTNRLGRMLAPMGVRYVVLVERAAPATEGTPAVPLPRGLERTMADQLDLRRVEADGAIRLYENDAFTPMRASLASADADALDDATSLFRAAARLDDTRSEPVLGDGSGHARYRGELRDGGAVYLAAASSDNWRLGVGGAEAQRSKALGWANVFRFEGNGIVDAVLEYRTPLLHRAVMGLQVVLWALVGRALVLGAARRRREAAA